MPHQQAHQPSQYIPFLKPSLKAEGRPFCLSSRAGKPEMDSLPEKLTTVNMDSMERAPLGSPMDSIPEKSETTMDLLASSTASMSPETPTTSSSIPSCTDILLYPFRAAYDAVYGIGPKSVFIARVFGLLALLAGAVVYFGLTLNQFLTQSLINRYTFDVRTVPHPDLVFCADMAAIGYGTPGFSVQATYVTPGKSIVGRRSRSLRNKRSETETPVNLQLKKLSVGKDIRLMSWSGISPNATCYLMAMSTLLPLSGLVSSVVAYSYSVWLGAPVSSRDDTEFLIDTFSYGLLHPTVVKEFLAGSRSSLGAVDLYQGSINCASQILWEFYQSQSPNDGKLIQETPNGEFYDPYPTQVCKLYTELNGTQRQHFRYVEIDSYINNYYAAITSQKPDPDGLLWTVNVLSNERSFTVLNVLTSVGSMITWMLVFYRLFYGSFRLRPLGLVQAWILRGPMANRLKELYGKNWDVALAGDVMGTVSRRNRRTSSHASLSRAGTKDNLRSSSSQKSALSSGAFAASISDQVVAPVQDDKRLLPTPASEDGLSVPYPSLAPSSNGLAEGDATLSRPRATTPLEQDRDASLPNVGTTTPTSDSDRSAPMIPVAERRNPSIYVRNKVEDLSRRLGYLEETNKIMHDLYFNTDDIFTMMGVDAVEKKMREREP